MVALYIALEPATGESITIARVGDRSLLVDAARKAIREAFDHAHEAAKLDSNLGVLHQAEANRLLEALGKLIPEMLPLSGEGDQPVSTAFKM